jgi:hypothetical protein
VRDFPTMSTAVHMEPKRRKIGVIESNAKYRYLKN